MATSARQLDQQHKQTAVSDGSGVDLLTPEEARSFFDARVEALLNISGEEFLRRWDSGEFQPVPYGPEGRAIGELVMMISFARRTQS